MAVKIDWIAYARQFLDIPEIKYLENEQLYEEEILDSNFSYVIRIYTKDKDGEKKQSCILKHASPYIKYLGFPLDLERTHLEYKALMKFHVLSPGSVPRPYSFKPDINTVCMEDLHGYEVLRNLLMQGEFTLKVADNIGRHLGIIHNKTHVATIGAEGIQALDKMFKNTNMVSLTEQFFFTRPFTRGDETNKCSAEVKAREGRVYDDPEVTQTVQKMLKVFLEKKECLLHGDLHTGSILVNFQDARFIDLEFAHVGPAAFDLGLLIAHFIFSYYRNVLTGDDSDRRIVAYEMVDACRNLVNIYLEHQTASVGDRETYVENLMSETAGFAGCEIVRRLVGAAYDPDQADCGEGEVACLDAGIDLLKAAHRIDSIGALYFIAMRLC